MREGEREGEEKETEAAKFRPFSPLSCNRHFRLTISGQSAQFARLNAHFGAIITVFS